MTRDRNALLDRLEVELPQPPGAFERLVDRRERKARRGRAAAGVVGVGLTGAIVVGAFSLSGGGDADRIEPRGAAVPLVAAPGQYYYVRSVSWFPADNGAPAPSGELWVGVDDSGRLRFGNDDDRFEAGEFPGEILEELSTDPGALLGQLTQRGSPQGASPNPIASSSPGRSQETTSLLRTLQDLLTLGSDVFLTPEQIAAMFEAAQGLDEITTDAGVVDPYGRAAVRLSWVVDYNIGPGSRVEWYFEPSTGQFMGELWVNQRTDDVEAASLIEQAGIASSVDERPSPEASYVPEGTAQPDLFGSSEVVAPTPKPA